MLRWSVSLGVLVAMLMATSNDAMAQRRQPVRNFIRQIGAGWGTGYHWNNSGTNIDYYSPYSSTNTPQHTIQDTTTQNTDRIDNRTFNSTQSINQIPSNSATQLFRDQNIPQNSTINFGNRSIINNNTQSTIDDNSRINQFLQPYHRSGQTAPNQTIYQGSTWKPAIQPSTDQIQRGTNQWNSKFGDYFDPQRTDNQK